MASIGMSGGGSKLLVPLVAGVALFGAGSVFVGQTRQLQDVKARLAAMQQEAAQHRAENENLTQQLAALQSERMTLEERLADFRSQFASATTELETSRANLADLGARYDKLAQAQSELHVQVATAVSERDEAKRKVMQLEERNQEVTRAMNRMRERLALLNRDYQRMSERVATLEVAPPSAVDVIGAVGLDAESRRTDYPSLSATPGAPASAPSATAPSTASISSYSPQGLVELPPIVVSTHSGVGARSSVRGRLLDVNPAHNFVVLDKGSQDGVRVGMRFDILRGGIHVGQATVVRVRPKLSACDIVRASTPSQLEVGDAAVQSGH
jgi:hypothetical protein